MGSKKLTTTLKLKGRKHPQEADYATEKLAQEMAEEYLNSMESREGDCE